MGGRSHRTSGKENRASRSNRVRSKNNPFSVNRPKESLAMLGANNKPRAATEDLSDESEDTAPTTKKTDAKTDAFWDAMDAKAKDEKYSQSSQSQSEKQIRDVMNNFQLESKDDEEEDVDIGKDAVDDSDSVPLRKPKKKGFQPPRFADGTTSPEYGKKSKKRSKSSRVAKSGSLKKKRSSVRTKAKAKSGAVKTQRTLFDFAVKK